MKKKVKRPVVKLTKQSTADLAVPETKERNIRLSGVWRLSQKLPWPTTLKKVLENGFKYKGKTYKSISRVAIGMVNRPISG